MDRRTLAIGTAIALAFACGAGLGRDASADDGPLDLSALLSCDEYTGQQFKAGEQDAAEYSIGAPATPAAVLGHYKKCAEAAGWTVSTFVEDAGVLEVRKDTVTVKVVTEVRLMAVVE